MCVCVWWIIITINIQTGHNHKSIKCYLYLSVSYSFLVCTSTSYSILTFQHSTFNHLQFQQPNWTELKLWTNICKRYSRYLMCPIILQYKYYFFFFFMFDDGWEAGFCWILSRNAEKCIRKKKRTQRNKWIIKING